MASREVTVELVHRWERAGRSRPQIVVFAALGLLLIAVSTAGCRGASVRQGSEIVTPAGTSTQVVAAAAPASAASATPPPTSTPVPLTPTATRSASVPAATPPAVEAKIEIVWPHDGASVKDADLANITAYLLAIPGDGDAASRLDPPSCDWSPVVRLWSALNNHPAQPVRIGQKRMVTKGGRIFPAWDFNDVDVAPARDPANRLLFFVTVDGVRTRSNVWAHGADARTLFPQQDNPLEVTRARPTAVDAIIEIVWPKDGLRVEEARTANITGYLFRAGTMRAVAADAIWRPVVRLHWSLNNDAEVAPGEGIPGLPRVVTGSNGVKFLAWDFNDVDISATSDSLNRLFFWVTVDGVTTYSNVWAHAVDARTLFPQPDVLNSCD